MVALSVAGIIVALIILDISFCRIALLLKFRGRRKSGGAVNGYPEIGGRLAVSVAPGMFHHRGHMWAHWRPEGSVVVGADDLLHRVIGRIDEVRPPARGATLKQGEKAVLLRQDDRVMYLTSPVTGTVEKVNDEVVGDSTLLKESPYEKGWIFTVRPERPKEDIENMMLADSAEIWMDKEARRIRFFLENRLRTAESVKSGGAMDINGVLESLSEESWVLFKDQFVYQQEWRS